MAKYFNIFPRLTYDIDNKGNEKLVTDIFRRIKVREDMKDNMVLFAKYQVPNGETPEVVSYKHLGTTDYFWIICMTNNVIDRYHDWPMSSRDFEQYVKDKYTNPFAIHHYEATKTSGITTPQGPNDYSHLMEVNSDYVGAVSVSNYEYEQRLQDEKRSINLIEPRFVPLFIEEFEKLVAE